MLRRLELKKFRGFTDLTLELRPVTVVVGPNSSGKTSILRAIHLATRALAMALAEGSPWLNEKSPGWIGVCEDLVIGDHTRLMPLADWASLFTNREVAPGGSFSLALSFDGTETIEALHVNVVCARNQQIKLEVSVLAPRIFAKAAELRKKSKFRVPLLVDEIQKAAPIARFVPSFYNVVLEEEPRARAVVERLLGSADQSRILRNLIRTLDAGAQERLNTILERTVGARLDPWTTQEDERLAIYFRDNNGPLELSSAGSGLINLVALFTLLERSRNERSQDRSTLFLLDEPEAHLHPRLQGTIGEALAATASEFGAQVIIATHSVEMINRVGQRSDAALVSVDRSTSTATELLPEVNLVRELSVWCDLTPFASLNFLASRQILFYEGPSDREIITRCAEVLFRSDDARRGRFQRWTFVPLQGSGNANAPAILKSVLTPELFPDLRDAPVRVIVVLDRDYRRTPGWRPVPGTPAHFEAREVVWERHSIESLFVEPGILAGWVAPLLRGLEAPSELQLREVVRGSIAEVDAMEALLDPAIDALTLQYVKEATRASREDDRDWTHATRRARSEVRDAPAVWQQGHARFKEVMRLLRERLPGLHGQLPASVEGVLRAAPISQLGKPEELIPTEIVRLLRHMADDPRKVYIRVVSDAPNETD